MSNVLIFFGFSWMVVGAVIGLFVGRQHEPHLHLLEQIAERGSLLEYHRTLDAYKWKVTIHAHSLLFPLVAIAIGLTIPRLSYPDSGIAILGYCLMAAGPIWTLGGLRLLKPLMAVGDTLLLGSIIATAYGMARTI
jgi:hypothetical protein